MVRISQKQLQIDKTSKRMIIVTSVATFVVIFCAVASQMMLGQMMYQNRIVSAKKVALKQLESNKKAVENLNESYTTFVSSPQNVIGGISSGGGPQDGDNAKIVLDALPSKYDFPALATSLEKLLKSQNVEIVSITGTDDEVAQGAVTANGQPKVVAIPFSVSFKGDYQAVQNVVKTFETSIRPIQVQTMSVTASNGELTVSVSAQTFFQPEKTFSVGSKVIK